MHKKSMLIKRIDRLGIYHEALSVFFFPFFLRTVLTGANPPIAAIHAFLSASPVACIVNVVSGPVI